MISLIDPIVTKDPHLRDRALDELCRDMDLQTLMSAATELDHFRRVSENLYDRVRSLFFLAAIFRYHVPERLRPDQVGHVPYDAYEHLLGRRFHEALDRFWDDVRSQQIGLGVASGLASAYHLLGFQTLADQVRRSVRTVRGNQWMFRIGHPADHPLRIQRELLQPDPTSGNWPLLTERTAVRMDFSHAGWSDIFFLGMDYPEGAQVVNASIDLAVRGRDAVPQPPIATFLRVIDRPVLRLVSVDLQAVAEIEEVDEVFDFARDYLGLLKAAVIAAGIVPPGMEGGQQRMADLMGRLVRPGYGLELVSSVNGIPKGSRLAVSTNLLGSLIALCMRATGQVGRLQGRLDEPDRRLVAARAILGEWLGGSGGGWQDSGGLWPGIKLIRGCLATAGDPEFGISRGRLLPSHELLGAQQISPQTRQRLQDSLILVHGGMAQNVGPILEMVTEKYLLRSAAPWQARQGAIAILQEIVSALQQGDLRRVGQLTTENFQGPLQEIIPWCTNQYTDQLIQDCQRQFGDQFWGFWMLGGMAGGGMGFLFDPAVKPTAQDWLQQHLATTKRAQQTGQPFAMDPVVYDFAINDRGSWAELRQGTAAAMPDGYYGILVPKWLRTPTRELSPQVQRELAQLGDALRQQSHRASAGTMLLERLLPTRQAVEVEDSLPQLLAAHGFDREQHEQIRSELKLGQIGLAQNRLRSGTRVEDVGRGDVVETRRGADPTAEAAGRQALRESQVAVVTLAAGVGSRWTGGAGVVKGLNPFCKLGGTHRTFLEVHLAKSRAASQQFAAVIPHVFTTGYLTHRPIEEHLAACQNYGYRGPVFLSPGRTVGLRMIPTVRDLRFAWEEMPQQVLDAQQQKVRESLRAALLNWAAATGEAEDYTDNLPLQCLHPVGHWYEIPNLLRNGVLADMLSAHPQLRYLLLHNVDTLGASLQPDLLGRHILSDACLSVEVLGRRIDDRGGGLARVDGKLRLVEGLAMPSEEDEFRLTYYNSMTTWIDIDQLLRVFGLSRTSLSDAAAVDHAVRVMARRMPTYVTLKDVKKRWGYGQEDVYPVAQFEKLWGDMTGLPEVSSQYLAVDVPRGQQLKDPAQLDSWLRDGSADYVSQLCAWQ